MKYALTTDNLLYKGEMTKRYLSFLEDDEEAFVLYDINGKQSYCGTFEVYAESDNLDTLITLQKERSNGKED